MHSAQKEQNEKSDASLRQERIGPGEGLYERR